MEKEYDRKEATMITEPIISTDEARAALARVALRNSCNYVVGTETMTLAHRDEPHIANVLCDQPIRLARLCDGTPEGWSQRDRTHRSACSAAMSTPLTS
jgi:hypothetical protein